MKKASVALVVLCAWVSAATAQSLLTLYGKMDVGYGVSNGGRMEGRGGHEGKFQQWGNGYGTSRWGLRGSEELGNGLKVYFQLESGINPETGAANGFNRAAIVGVSGRWGAVQFGRQDAVFDSVLADFSLSGDPTLTCANCNAGISSGQRISRYDSAATYISPDFGGFSFRAQYVSKNDEAGVGNLGDKNLYSVGATYEWGSLTVAGAYESKPVSDPDVRASWGVAAKYNFGAWTMAGGYFDNHYRSDGKGFYLGAIAPVGGFQIGAQVAYNIKAYSEDGDKIKPLAWQLFAFYNLSKRTNLYALYGGINNDAKVFVNALRRNSFAVGLLHNF